MEKKKNGEKDSMAEAQEMGLNAAKLEKLIEMMQEQIEEETEIIKTLMECKNAIMEAVIKMLAQSFSTQSKLMSGLLKQ